MIEADFEICDAGVARWRRQAWSRVERVLGLTLCVRLRMGEVL